MEKITGLWIIFAIPIVVSTFFNNLLYALIFLIFEFTVMYFLVRSHFQNIYTYKMKIAKSQLKENQLILGVAFGISISIFINSMYRVVDYLDVQNKFTADLVTMIFAGIGIIFIVWFINKINNT